MFTTLYEVPLQEFRRHNSSLGASRDRVQLLRGSTDKSPLLGGQGYNASGALLRERGQISGASAAVRCFCAMLMQLCSRPSTTSLSM